ncbi:MAG: class I SAM-dependent methyltransferase [Pseudomonadota bacterium]
MRLNKRPANSENAAGGTTEVLNSRLLPEVFNRFEPGDPVRVLDLGPGSADTVAFLSQFQVRVSFVDLLEHADQLKPAETPTAGQALNLIANLLHLPQDAKFDVILLWDVVHHLSPNMLEALSGILESHTTRSTTGYGFGSLQNDRVHEAFEYGIRDPNQIIQRNSSYSPFTAHSQQQMNQKFVCLHIAKATLLQEGKLELFFERQY